jgi:hypothetical protein
MSDDNPHSDLESELWFLRWFYQECDFGPADSDVKEALKDEFRKRYGFLPEGYDRE